MSTAYPTQTLLHVELRHLMCAVQLNGVNVFNHPGADTMTTTRTVVGQYVLEGENRLTVYVGHPAGGEADGASHATVALYRADEGQMPMETTPVLYWTYDPALVEISDAGVVQAYEERTRIAQAHGRWSWQDAQPYNPETDQPDLVAAIQELSSALTRRDIATLHRLHAVRYEEWGRVFADDASVVQADQEELWTDLFATDDFAVASYDPSEIAYVSAADGRIVQVVMPDGMSPIVARGGEILYEMKLNLSHLPQGWTLVR